jgi:hypothetical protein
VPISSDLCRRRQLPGGKPELAETQFAGMRRINDPTASGLRPGRARAGSACRREGVVLLRVKVWEDGGVCSATC